MKTPDFFHKKVYEVPFAVPRILKVYKMKETKEQILSNLLTKGSAIKHILPFLNGRDFFGKTQCAFLAIIVLNLQAKKLRNP